MSASPPSQPNDPNASSIRAPRETVAQNGATTTTYLGREVDAHMVDLLERHGGKAWYNGLGEEGWHFQVNAPDPITALVERNVIQLRPDEPEVVRTVNAQELADDDEPDPKCLPVFGRDGVLVEGYAHLLSAPAKAGKTTLLGSIVRDRLDAGHTVRWLTEEPKSVWRKRLRRLGGDWRRLTLVLPGDDEATLLADAYSCADDVVIVDTVRAFIPCDDENDAAKRGKTIRPWAHMAHETGKTLILVVHARKGGGQHGEAIAGSHELLAAVDQAIEITRVGDDESHRRKLTTLGREFEPVELIYQMVADGSLMALAGDARAVQLEEFNHAVLAAMPRGILLSIQEVIAELDGRPNRLRVTRALTRLADQGLVKRDPPFAEKTKPSSVRWVRL